MSRQSVTSPSESLSCRWAQRFSSARSSPSAPRYSAIDVFQNRTSTTCPRAIARSYSTAYQWSGCIPAARAFSRRFLASGNVGGPVDVT